MSDDLLNQLVTNYERLTLDPVPPEGTLCYSAIADETMAPGYMVWIMDSRNASTVLRVLPQYYASADAAALVCRSLAPPGSSVDHVDTRDPLVSLVRARWLEQRELYPGADTRAHRILPYHLSELALADGSMGWFAWQEAIQTWGPDYMVLGTDYSASTLHPAFTMTAEGPPALFEAASGVRKVLAESLNVADRDVPVSGQSQIPPGLQRQLRVTNNGYS